MYTYVLWILKKTMQGLLYKIGECGRERKPQQLEVLARMSKNGD